MRLSYVKFSLLLFLTGTSAAWGADYLYSPKPVTAEDSEGVLVREVTIKKGDTLSRLSRNYSGRGYYYPQILLFNQIKNPHRIFPGQVVRVPLSAQTAKTVRHTKVSHIAVQAQRPAPVATTVTEIQQKPVEKQKPVVVHAAHGEKNLYSRALATFNKGDCEGAIKQFDAFISRYPASAMLPEATLNRAECYLKMSAR